MDRDGNDDDHHTDDDQLSAPVQRPGSALYDEYLREVTAWSARVLRSGPALRWGAAGLVAMVATLTTLYQVQPEEVGVVVRLGKYVRTTEPGLRMKIPFVEQVFKIPVQRQLKEEFGFRTTQAAVRTTFSKEDFSAEAMMRQVVGDRTVTEVLTVGRQAIETRAEELLRSLTQQYEMGITIEQVVLQDVNPPDPVKPSWDEVNQAQQQRDRMINEARAEYNKVVPRAKGEAQQTVLEAEGYGLNRVNRAQGESARFGSVAAAYRRAPEVTRQRLYLETMERVLPRMGGQLFLDPAITGLVPLLSLDALRGAAATAPATATAPSASLTGGGR